MMMVAKIRVTANANGFQLGTLGLLAKYFQIARLTNISTSIGRGYEKRAHPAQSHDYDA